MGIKATIQALAAPRNRVARFVADRRGAVSLEYGLIISLVIVGFLAGLSLFGGTNGGAWDTMTGKLIAVIKGG
jgi:Flp pilus assembly pilin Flp